MMSCRQSALVLFLGLALIGWSANATLIKTVMHHKTKQHHIADSSNTADGAESDQESNGSDDGAEDDGDDDDDDEEDEAPITRQKKVVPVAALPQVAAVSPLMANTPKVSTQLVQAASPSRLSKMEAVNAQIGTKGAQLELKQTMLPHRTKETLDNKKHTHSELKPVVLSTVANKVSAPLELAKKDVQVFEKALADNRQAQLELKQRIAHLSNASESSQEIDAAASLMANETQSAATANMFAQMWKELRMFEVPFYAEHVQEELQRLEHEHSTLEAEMAAARDNLSTQEEKEAKEEREEKQTRNALNVEADEEQVTDIAGNPHYHSFWPAVVYGANHVHGKVEKNAYMNFWDMKPKRQESYLGGCFVYLVAGICLAYLHNSVRARSTKFFAAAPRYGPRGTKYFSFSLLDCFSVPNVCLIGCCCPCLRWADTTDRHSGPTGSMYVSYWKAFIAFFSLTLLFSFTWGISSLFLIVLGVFYRQQLRKSYDLENGTVSTIAFDILTWMFCQPCAIIQEAREESLLEAAVDP